MGTVDILTHFRTAEQTVLRAYPHRHYGETVTVERFPRLTAVETFDTIDVRAVTATKLSICYDRETGFLGNDMRGQEPLFTCSSIFRDRCRAIYIWQDRRR